MKVIGVSPETNTKRETFFKLVFGQGRGYVCIASLSSGKKFSEEFFMYPDDLPSLLEHINRQYTGANLYFCPQLLREKKRTKESVAVTPNAWADLDTCEPDNLLVLPTVVLESSPERFQALWCFASEVDPDDAEDLSRRIAYKHADQGADRSGWDLTQLLRVPFTYNYKYSDPQVVKVIEANRNTYNLDDFGEYPQASGYQYLDIPMPESFPDSAEDLLQGRRLQINPLVWKLFGEEPDRGKSWSEPLWQLQMLCFEAGFTREEVFTIAQAAKCNKYARDGRSARLLWKEVCRAFAKNEEHTHLLGPSANSDLPELVSAEERRQAESEDSFIERYMAWAKSLGDAAPQYHQAGAFVALSSILAGSVRLPTSFGMIIPNLWFMILADTTLTRKTTAMDIAMDLVMEIDDDVLLATDGSIEGLLTSLGGRPGRPSVFLRDEFSGLLEMMVKRDYYAGMPELLTKLYDGKMQKRVLRKETISIRDPRLIVFAGGIKSKITSLLTFEHVSSGFMPRFIFITAESDIARLKPLGPPTGWTDNNRGAIKSELQDMADHYRVMQKIQIGSGKVSIEAPKMWDAVLTEDAWFRYNRIESDMLKSGVESDKPDILTPVFDRLSKSILKAAVLIAATRQREDGVIVEEVDIVRASMYGEQWRAHVVEIMNSVGKGQGERQLDLILNAIQTHEGVSRSKLMQNYHLNARDAEQVFSTLEQRGLITRSRAGRTEQYYPVKSRRA